MRILVTGATGYVGGRLVPLLLHDGHDVRCLTRRPEKLRDVPWADRVEIRRGDVLERDGLEALLEAIEVVYYLVHAIGSGADFEMADRTAAANLASAAAAAGVRQIVFLGGLEPRDEPVSRTWRRGPR